MKDSQMIRKAALDYIEGWYQADDVRMSRALSPDLAKRRIVSSTEIWHVDKAWMLDATAAGRGRLERPEDGRKDIAILDQTDSTASVKIVSEAFVDYLHLTRTEDGWEIVTALWNVHSE